MADPPPGAIQITEPIVFEIETPTIPGLPTLTTPPGIGLGGAAISFHYICPLSIHCGADIPCGPSYTLPLSLSIPLPTFSFPPTFNFPVFGFRIEIPPSIFLSCPAFEEKTVTKQKEKDAKKDADKTKPPTKEDHKTSGKSLCVYDMSKDPKVFTKTITTLIE